MDTVALIPTRHPERPRPIPAPVRVFAAMLGVPEPSAAQWRRIGEQLTAGDARMDRLVEWMCTVGATRLARCSTVIAHLTRYVGWLLGVDDEWLPRSFRDAVRILSHKLRALSNPDDSTRQLAAPMVEDRMGRHYPMLPVRGEREQRAFLRIMTGKRPPMIGAAVHVGAAA